MVEVLFGTFDEFINEYHSTECEADIVLKSQWNGLKKIIESDPNDI